MSELSSDDRVRHTFTVEIDGEADGFASNSAQMEQALWESMDRGPLARVWTVRHDGYVPIDVEASR